MFLWLVTFIAQHYYFLRNTEEALKYIEIAIEHTPTLMDLYCIKGRILQAAGDWVRGQELFEEARILDKADRALNALSSKQMLKVDMIDAAEDTMNIFFNACGYETGVHEV